MENLRRLSNVLIFLLRISMGVMFFYAGITKVLDSTWTAAGYLQGAQTFAPLYNWLLQPNILPVVNFINQWGLLLLGLALISGLFIRYTAWLAALLMLLYYIPVLNFPYVSQHAFLVDEHIIYILVLILLAVTKSGKIFGLDKLLNR